MSLFHVARADLRERIAAEGLRPHAREDAPWGLQGRRVFLWVSLPAAERWRTYWHGDEPADIWEILVEPPDLQPDTYAQRQSSEVARTRYADARATASPIAAGDLRRLN